MSKLKLLVSPSKLETFRKYIDGEYNGYITKEKVIESIKGLTPWEPRMEVGSAIHAILEHGADRFRVQDTDRFLVQVDDMPGQVELFEDELEIVLKHRSQYPNMVYEVSHKHWLNLVVGDQFVDVLMMMKIDGMNGEEIHETKSTDKTIDFSMYERSLQWKIYTHTLGCPFVQYNIFKYNKPRKGHRTITKQHTRFYAYNGVKREIERWMRFFIEFCQRENLIEFVKSKY